MKLWIATSNKGKLREFQSIAQNMKLEIYSPNEFKSYFYPDETGSTFEENARIKAKALKSFCADDWVLAEDSGLVVEGLNGMPGIHSARYAGDNASDAENVNKLIKMLSIRSPQNRNASFQCAMVALSPTNEEFIFNGEIKGQIAKHMSGSSGFGYDPIFIPEGENKSFSDLGPAFKNKVSHRRKAFENFLEKVMR